MEDIFLDTNVIIDFLIEREPFVESAAVLFALAEKNKIKIYISSLSFSNLYYIIRKVIGRAKALELLQNLTKISTVLQVDTIIIQQALNANFTDFEDAIQHFCAVQLTNIKAIITRNTADFKHSQIPVFTPDEYLALLVKNPM